MENIIKALEWVMNIGYSGDIKLMLKELKESTGKDYYVVDTVWSGGSYIKIKEVK